MNGHRYILAMPSDDARRWAHIAPAWKGAEVLRAKPHAASIRMDGG